MDGDVLGALVALCVLGAAGTQAVLAGPLVSARHVSVLTPLLARVGSYVVLDCELDFPQNIPIPYSLHWNKDGHQIFSFDREIETAPEYEARITLVDESDKEYGRGSVNITSVRESDAGVYQCRVIFPNRSPVSRNNGTWYRLDVGGDNLISVPPMNVTILEYQSASFHCIRKHIDSVIRWKKDGEPITTLADLSARSWVLDNGSLSINPTSMNDLGQYTCEVVDAEGNHQIASAFLNVQYKAKVVSAVEKQYLPYGNSYMLDCDFRANPPITSLRWEKDGFLFDAHNVNGVFNSRNGSLLFDKVDESHAGEYSCTPYNDLGTQGPSPIITVIVQRPPTFTATPRNVYLRKLGDSIELPCDAIDSEGRHRPAIIWTKKDGTKLPEGRYSLEGGNLTIESITASDSGHYQCAATNEAATVTTETELVIENVPPRAPYAVEVSTTADSAVMRWAPATSVSRPRTEYQVWYRPVDVAEWRTMKVSSSRSTEATIGNLSPGREYEFMVLSQDLHGDGMFSKSIRATTKANSVETQSVERREPLGAGVGGASGAALSPPRDLKVQLTTDGYRVEWSPPSHGLELLRVYVVRWWRGPDDMLLMGSAETKHTFYLIKELEEDEVYHFQVNALSMSDFQAFSTTVSVHVPAYGRIRAAVAGVACLLLLLLGGALLWFSRHRLRRKPKDTSKAREDY